MCLILIPATVCVCLERDELNNYRIYKYLHVLNEYVSTEKPCKNASS